MSWKPTPTLPDLKDVETALRANPSTPRTLIDKGDVDAAIAAAAKPMQRTYVWPYQMHGSIGPSCAVADYQDGHIRVWSGTQNPHILRADLALLLQRPETEIDVIRLEAAGCYGRNCADDVSADAVLLSRAVGRPVRVQLTREQEHAWEPKGTAQLMDVNGGLNADGSVAGYDFATRYPVQRRADAGAAADRHGRAGPGRVRDGRPHRDPALRLRSHARGGARHAADRARLVASRRLGAAEHLCP